MRELRSQITRDQMLALRAAQYLNGAPEILADALKVFSASFTKTCTPMAKPPRRFTHEDNLLEAKHRAAVAAVLRFGFELGKCSR